MLSVNILMPQVRGLAGPLLKRAASVELDWDLRQRSRFEATDSAGRRLGIFLPRGSVVRGGDVLVAEDGSLVVVRAAPQPVLVVRQDPHGPCSAGHSRLAGLEVMAADTQRIRPGRAWVMTNLRTHEGLQEVVRFIETRGLLAA